MIITTTLTSGALPDLQQMLRSRGWAVRERPLLCYQYLAQWTEFDRALARLDRFGVIVFTSPRGGTAFRARVAALRLNLGIRQQCWALGPATAASLPRDVNLRIPSQPTDGAGLAELLLAEGITGPVLHCAGRNHREELGTRLRAAGVGVETVVCYETVIADDGVIAESLRDTRLALIGSHRVITRAAALRGRTGPGLVCLGPATAATARSMGWEPLAVADSPSAQGVARALDRLGMVAANR